MLSAKPLSKTQLILLRKATDLELETSLQGVVAGYTVAAIAVAICTALAVAQPGNLMLYLVLATVLVHMAYTKHRDHRFNQLIKHQAEIIDAFQSKIRGNIAN